MLSDLNTHKISSIEEFNEIKKNGISVFYFSADWIQSSRIMEKEIISLEEKASDKYKVILIDIEEGKDIAIKNGFSSYPVTQIYKDNTLMFNTIGFEKEENLSSKLRELF